MDRIDEPTPNGGAYSIAYYFNDQGEMVDKTLATKIIIKEFSADDKLIYTTHGNFDPSLIKETLAESEIPSTNGDIKSM